MENEKNKGEMTMTWLAWQRLIEAMAQPDFKERLFKLANVRVPGIEEPQDIFVLAPPKQRERRLK
jgi:hypothetical protein